MTTIEISPTNRDLLDELRGKMRERHPEIWQYDDPPDDAVVGYAVEHALRCHDAAEPPDDRDRKQPGDRGAVLSDHDLVEALNRHNPFGGYNAWLPLSDATRRKLRQTLSRYEERK